MIRRASPADRDTVLAVLTEAFGGDSLAGWLFPDPDPAERDRLARRFHLHQVTDPAAEVYLSDEDGVAVWHLVPGPAAESEQPDRAVLGETADRLAALGRALAPRRPAVAHLHLSCMGVTGARQGAGIGSAMLRHRLAEADAEQLGAYLEASSPRSRALYRRHGFTDLGDPVEPTGGPTLWPMWRTPKTLTSQQKKESR